MAQTTIKTGVVLELQLTLNETEAAALDALADYNTDAFLRVFYKEMGTHYLQPHEAGLRALFSKIRETVPYALEAVDNTRKRLRAAGLNDTLSLQKRAVQ